jgi:diaminopimelate decarboxylase
VRRLVPASLVAIPPEASHPIVPTSSGVDVEEWSCEALAERFGTPLFVVSERRLRQNAARLAGALRAGWPYGETRLLPSIKASPMLATRLVLTDEGLGCDTFGATELEIALRAHVPGRLISVNGASKDAALVRRAVAAGARITLDSARELALVEDVARELGVVAPIRLRLRPRLTKLDADTDFAEGVAIRDAADAYKAGIPIDDVAELGRRAIDSRHVDLLGVHVHFGRHTAELHLWQAMLRDFVELLAEMAATWPGWVPAEIDIGGGWPSSPGDPPGRRSPARRGRPLPHATAEYAELLASTLAAELARAGLAHPTLALEAEPGRALYADAGLHLARVVNVKRQTDPTQRVWIETDTSEAFMPDTIVEQALFPVVAIGAGEGPPVRGDVTGISCNFDTIAEDVELRSVEPGDLIAFMETGAYQEAGASNFNGLPRPGTVLVNGTAAEIIKRRETLEDVLARDVAPSWLT